MNAIVVDDEVVVVNAIKRRVAWSKFGIQEVFVAHGLSGAQDIFRHENIDLMLCDIEMPGGSGLQLFEWVKCHYPWVECIFVTCHPDFDYIRKALQLGSLDYVLKPLDYEELDEILKKAVKRMDGKSGSQYQKASDPVTDTEVMINDADAIRKVKAYIDGHIREHIAVDTLAEYVHLNSHYLMRLFKKNTGMSILEYITQMRINRAKLLLSKTDDTINEVADAVGYGNYTYFFRLFKKMTGKTPAAYRLSCTGIAQECMRS